MKKNLVLEYRIKRLESLMKQDKENLISEFAKICKSCNLPEPTITRNRAVCEFMMKSFYRRIQKRMRNFDILKYYQDEPVKLVCNLSDGSLDIHFLRTKERVPLDEYTPVEFAYRDRVLSYIGNALDDILNDYRKDFYN